jgi:hypothetical protein
LEKFSNHKKSAESAESLRMRMIARETREKSRINDPRLERHGKNSEERLNKFFKC